ncbi:WD40/YVTN/BNR-like repeat-containing protein [Micromonospora sp. NPDC003776]
MKLQTRRLPVIIAAVLVLALAAFGLQRLAFPDRSDAGREKAEAAEHEGEEEDEGGPQRPADYLTLKWTSAQDVTQEQVERSKRQAAAIPRGAGGAWSLVGPSNVGGRVVDLVVDPRNPDTVYTAVSGGGVWKSTDAGEHWAPAWPDGQTQVMGALAMGPDGTLWAGTGEANPSGGGLTYFGDGIYKSTDGGATWQHWGLIDSAAIGRIVVDPTDPQRVFVAASGSISRSVSQRGIYRVDNGGKDWKLVLAPPNDTTGGIDLAVDPSNHNRVFAALWDHKRNNGARTYGGIGSGLFRSDDGGDSWRRLENIVGPLSSYDQTGTGLHADASLGRIGVALAPSNPQRVYVVFGSPYGPDKGFYVSNDGGDSFTVGGRPGASGGYQWWFGRLWVDPANPDHLFSADVNLRESVDAGATWRTSGGVHADQHAMQWDPNVPNRVYLGNDGGMYRSDNNGAGGSWKHASYEPWNQSYHLAVAADDPNRLATGLQDNGSVRTWTATAEPGDLSQWNAFGGGDGHEVVIDYTDHDIYYECLQVGSCRRHEDVGGVTRNIPLGARHSSRITTDAPLILDPNNPEVVYFGGNVLDRSTDRGATFTQISPPGDALTGPVPAEEDDLGPFYSNQYATITWIAPAKTAPNTIYLGTDTGRLWKTTDLGAHWTEFTGKGLPQRWVNAIVVDPTDADHVYVAYSGYREGDESANIWQTTDGGRTWSNISGNLPNAPVEMITYDQPQHQLYAATDFGVFYLKNGKKNWSRLGQGLPATSVLDIKLTGDGSTIYAATFGRSVWKLPVPRD